MPRYGPIPSGKTRLVLRTASGEVLVNLLVDNGSENVVVLPDGHGLRLIGIDARTV